MIFWGKKSVKYMVRKTSGGFGSKPKYAWFGPVPVNAPCLRSFASV